MSLHSPGKAFRAALTKENPLQIVGTINANHASCWRSVPDIRRFISPAVAWRQGRWGCPISVFLLLMMC
ncbi:hypothetical protein EIMP300_76240 [Escherichia coli]|uniref:Methylisocitrate lyase n=1 Tax=Escherichia coli TaxID=562 RepID=A0A8S0G0M5_ECOLX|nr:hypothetical protein EIMP300_76240 [Escherichia coli]